ncbi:MAG: hypothetical protein ACX93N_00305 [Pseudohaliea sp.]
MPPFSLPPGIAAACGVIAFAVAMALSAQEKLERERSVRPSEVPEAARRWLRDAFEFLRSPRWYQDFYESGYTYEAKFKWRGQYYSVEFTSEGSLQDVEVEIGLADLPDEVRQNLRAHLSATYSTFEISRLQVQYSGAADDLEDFFDENENEGLTIRYEVEYTATLGAAPSQYREGLFDHEGRHLLSRRVILPPTENLLF